MLPVKHARALIDGRNAAPAAQMPGAEHAEDAAYGATLLRILINEGRVDLGAAMLITHTVKLDIDEAERVAPEGFGVVPLVPTAEMLRAKGVNSGLCLLRNNWKAMVAASEVDRG